VLGFPIVVMFLFGLIISPMSVDYVFAEDDLEKKRLEEQRELEKKERERFEEERKKTEKQSKEERKKFEEDIRESLKIEFDDLGSGSFADWVLVGTVILIIGVIGSTGFKILRPKKRKIVPTK